MRDYCAHQGGLYQSALYQLNSPQFPGVQYCNELKQNIKGIPYEIINHRVFGFQVEHFTLSKLVILALLISIPGYLLAQCNSV